MVVAKATDDHEAYLQTLKDLLGSSRTLSQLYRQIVNAPFYDKYHATNLELSLISLLHANHKRGVVERLGVSDTDFARSGFALADRPVRLIETPLKSKTNIIPRAFAERKRQETNDWSSLLGPTFNKSTSRLIQQASGVDYSVVYPIGETDYALIFSFFQVNNGTADRHDLFMQAYIDAVHEVLKKS